MSCLQEQQALYCSAIWVSCSSACSNKRPDKNNLRKEGVILAQLIIMDAKWWLQEPKAAEHIPLIVREQREINVTT